MAIYCRDHSINKNIYVSLHHQFPFRVDTPLVELQVQREWCKVSDATVKFTVVSNYQRSSWDWVAIYKVYCISRTSSLNVASQFDALKCLLRTGGLQTPQRLPGVRVGQGRARDTGAPHAE